MDNPPLILVNAVGMTSRLLELAPRMKALTDRGWVRTLVEAVPAVTCTAQATILTGQPPSGHGIVANGWLFRDTMEVRFWQQSNRLLQAEPLYVAARRRAAEASRTFRCAKLFWWFNQGAAVDWSVTPKPHYGADGNKVFGIAGSPDGLTGELERELGPFPFHTFWGPMAGLPCTDWIARCAAWIVRRHRPDLTLVYLPHLDYDPQRYGPQGTDMAKHVGELDTAFAEIEQAAVEVGARVWIVSEYGHVQVSMPVYLNRRLREAGLLTVRNGPFGETIDFFESRAFTVCDHQVAHVYVNSPLASVAAGFSLHRLKPAATDSHPGGAEPETTADLERLRELLATTPGVARVLVGDERSEFGLDHPRSGALIALAKPDAWFAYPYWLDDRRAPDFARTVDIHRKPGFDPCEMFFDPKLWWPKGRALRRMIQKKLGFRMLMDLIPLDASLVHGSHGLRAAEPMDRPILIGDGSAPPGSEMPMTAVRDCVLGAVDGD